MDARIVENRLRRTSVSADAEQLPGRDIRIGGEVDRLPVVRKDRLARIQGTSRIRGTWAPLSVLTQTMLARSLARSGRTAEATNAFDRVVEITTAAESLLAAAEFFAANGRESDARTLVDSILARRATMPAYQILRKASRIARRLHKGGPVAKRAMA